MPELSNETYAQLRGYVADLDKEIDIYREMLKIARGNGSSLPKNIGTPQENTEEVLRFLQSLHRYTKEGSTRLECRNKLVKILGKELGLEVRVDPFLEIFPEFARR